MLARSLLTSSASYTHDHRRAWTAPVHKGTTSPPCPSRSRCCRAGWLLLGGEGTIIGLIIIGLVGGFIARALVPGKQSMGVLQTILLGIVGSPFGCSSYP
jgi:hypothetical protein